MHHRTADTLRMFLYFDEASAEIDPGEVDREEDCWTKGRTRQALDFFFVHAFIFESMHSIRNVQSSTNEPPSMDSGEHRGAAVILLYTAHARCTWGAQPARVNATIMNSEENEDASIGP